MCLNLFLNKSEYSQFFVFTVPISPHLLSEDSVFGKIATHFGKHISLISYPN